jgi:excisionase family DNA binding protein
MSSDEAAAYLSISVNTLRNKARSGQLPASVTKLDGRRRWRRADLDAWVERQGSRPSRTEATISVEQQEAAWEAALSGE